MDYKDFISSIAFVANAHQEKTRPGAEAWRVFGSGEKNPYFTHPLWCAMMILLETKLPESIRIPGAYALLYHDVLEDTSATLPDHLPDEVKHLVKEMTYVGGFQEEKMKVPSKPPLVKLLKLYDKTATLYDRSPLNNIEQEWKEYTYQLSQDVKKEYGALNITKIADMFCRESSHTDAV